MLDLEDEGPAKLLGIDAAAPDSSLATGSGDDRIDVATEYTLHKKLTIPLRLFGPDKDKRVYPSTLQVKAFFQGAVVFSGTLVLKYEDSNGKARLNVSNTGSLLQRFRDHVVSGWALYPDAAVMYIVPPRARKMDSPSPSGSLIPDGLDEDEEVDNRALRSRRGSLQDLLGAAPYAAEGISGKQKSHTGDISSADAGVASALDLQGGTNEEEDLGDVSEESEGEDAGERTRLASEAVGLPFMDQGMSLESSRHHNGGYTPLTGLGNQRRVEESTPYSSWKPAAAPSHGGGAAAVGCVQTLTPVTGPIAGISVVELLAKLPNHQSNALLANNNISVPLALFGTSANDRVLVERIQLLANVADGQDLFDVGTFRLNCSKSTTSNRMKVSLGSSGTVFKRFSDSMWIHGWSKVTDTIMMAHMRVNNQPTNQPVCGGGGPVQFLDNLVQASAVAPSLPAATASAGAQASGLSGGIVGALSSSALAGALPGGWTAPRNVTAVGGSPTNPQGVCGVKRPLPGHGIDALIAAGVALDLSKKIRQSMDGPEGSAMHKLNRSIGHGNDLEMGRSHPCRAAAGGDIQPTYETPLPSPSLSVQPDTGLPLLPDVETMSSGWGGMTKRFLQVMNALQFPNTVKGGLRCYLKSLAMRPGSEGKDTLEIMYSFLQDACALGDLDAVEQIMAEVCEGDPENLAQVRTRLATAKEQLQQALDDKRSKEEDRKESIRQHKEDEGKMEALALDSLLMLDSSRVLRLNRADGPVQGDDNTAGGHVKRGDDTSKPAAWGPSHSQSPIAALDLDSATPSKPQQQQTAKFKRTGGSGMVELDLGSRNPGLVHAKQRLAEPKDVATFSGGQMTSASRGLGVIGQGSMQPLNAEGGRDAQTEQPQSKDLPSGWSMTLDPSGKPYYWHKVTQKTVWERPTDETPIS